MSQASSSTSSFNEHVFNNLENLPAELKQNFNLIRERNQKCHNLMKTIDEKSDDFLKTINNSDSKSKISKGHEKISNMYQRLKRHSYDNLELARQTYELVDKYIQQLDIDLAVFEEQVTAGHQVQPVVEKGPRMKKSSGSRKGRKKNEDDDIYQKSVKSPVAVEAAIRQILNPGATVPTDSLDMPVDPNEPTYCLCNQVSYGEMVCCDHNDCPIEWFHFACVGLTKTPRGKWYCPKCIKNKK